METINSTGILLGQICSVCLLISMYVIIYKKGPDFYDDLRGKDKMWQAIELSIVIWCLVFPHIAVCSMLGLTIADGLWTSMNSVFLMSVGGKVIREKLTNSHLINKSDETDK